jgi:hypothetical protein
MGRSTAKPRTIAKRNRDNTPLTNRTAGEAVDVVLGCVSAIVQRSSLPLGFGSIGFGYILWHFGGEQARTFGLLALGIGTCATLARIGAALEWIVEYGRNRAEVRLNTLDVQMLPRADESPEPKLDDAA